MDVQPRYAASAIVIVGSISPGVFQPRWLASQGLIPEAEADDVNDLIISPDFARFSTPWLQLEAVTERLTLTVSLTPYFDALRDLAVSVLSLLEHTPVNALGLNSTAHFDLKSEERWHQIGHMLAPKKGIWDQILKAPGTRSLTIEGVRDDGPGAVNVVVQPSAMITNGLFIEINDHYTRPEENALGSGWALDAIDRGWGTHTRRTGEIYSHLLSAVDDSAEGSE